MVVVHVKIMNAAALVAIARISVALCQQATSLDGALTQRALQLNLSPPITK
jgi:hypothetical protein